jgi:hypothetical protein
VLIPESEEGCVPDGIKLSHISYNYFDAADWICDGPGRPWKWPFLTSV